MAQGRDSKGRIKKGWRLTKGGRTVKAKPKKRRATKRRSTARRRTTKRRATRRRTTKRRSKRRFTTARAAWHDIARSTGLRAGDVAGKRHTRSEWVFVIR